MKIKKFTALIMAATMGGWLMTGCGGNTSMNTSESSSTNSATDTTETGDAKASDAEIQPTTITFWHVMTGVQETCLVELTDQFNAENEYGITVELINQGYLSDLSTKLTASAVADTLPDMAQAYNSYVYKYLDKVVHLDDFVANDFDNWDDIVKSYREENSEFGFISGVPFNKSTYVLYYNKTMFDELGLSVPETWDDLLSVGETIKSQKNLSAIGYDDLYGALEAILHQNGEDCVSEEGALFDTEGGLEAVTFLMDMYNNGYARLVGEDGYFSTVISNQMVGAYVGSTAGVSFIDTSSGWELGVAPLPGNVQKAANMAGTNLMMFAKDENNQKAVWEFMKFLTSADATLKWSMETGYLPVRQSVYESDTYQEFMEGDATATAAYSQVDAFFASPNNFSGSYDVRRDVNTKLEELFTEKADGETALSELVETINSDIK